MMTRKQFRILLLGLILICLAACQPQPAAQEPTLSFKGVELYSWQTDGGAWRFSLLPGTNREKTLAEVVAVPLDQAALKAALDGLPAGEIVLWVNRAEEDGQDELAFPPGGVIADILAYATEMGIDLEVLNP